VDIMRSAYYIRGLELMKLIFAVLDVLLTMGLTRCYKTGFLHLLVINTNLPHIWNRFRDIAFDRSIHRFRGLALLTNRCQGCVDATSPNLAKT